VGSSLAAVLAENAGCIARRVERDIAIKTVLVRDPARKRAVDPGPKAAFTANPDDLINDPEIAIVVELMGGVDAPLSLITRALRAGKHVVTANKHLLALHGPALFDLAAAKGVGLFYEASVAGGIPIVQTLKEGLAGNRIERIDGILNGTANHILSEMTASGIDFAAALGQAQELGYAEADPSFDIEGVDTAHKLVVLIRLAFGRDYPLADLPVRGITEVTPQDIQFAREFGCRIKLIAAVRDVDGNLEAWVSPSLVKESCLLSRVDGNYNAVRVQGNAVGPVMLHGQGAGGRPTASAVLADILGLCRLADARGHIPDNTGFANAHLARAEILPPELAASEHYFRFTVADRPGVMAAIARCMADHGISIAQAVQKGDAAGASVPIVFLTHAAQMKAVTATVRDIDAMDFIVQPTVHMKIL
jgi:homoserine dehydrogenase